MKIDPQKVKGAIVRDYSYHETSMIVVKGIRLFSRSVCCNAPQIKAKVFPKSACGGSDSLRFVVCTACYHATNLSVNDLQG